MPSYSAVGAGISEYRLKKINMKESDNVIIRKQSEEGVEQIRRLLFTLGTYTYVYFK
jgi:hypothetical protein